MSGGRRSRHWRLVAAGIIALSSLVSLACGTARRGEALRGPLTLADDETRHGQQVFLRHCNKCHPGGEAGLGPGINDKPLPNFLKHFQVRQGMGTMPGFSAEEINDEDMAALKKYLSALRSHG